MSSDPSVRQTPSERLRLQDSPAKSSGGAFVLYCMTAQRRGRWNFALQQAAYRAAQRQRPLLVVEVLRCDRPWANRRHHQLVLDGMRDNAEYFAAHRTAYWPLVESCRGEAAHVLAALLKQCSAAVADDHPLDGDLPAGVLGDEAACAIERVDGAGLLPIRAADRAFPTAFAFRRALQSLLPEHLPILPAEDPLAGLSLPSLGAIPSVLRSLMSVCEDNALAEQLLWDDRISPAPAGSRRAVPSTTNAEAVRRLHRAALALIEAHCRRLDRLPIDQGVEPVEKFRGGAAAAGERLKGFISHRLARYEQRNDPEADATSGLSPYLRLGQISVHEIFCAVADAVRWSPDRLSPRATGAREGWWGMGRPAEAFLDELVTWRELGLNFAVHRPGEIDQPDSLPDWARETLDAHAGDDRPRVYSPEQFEAAQTHDRLWNAAQRQLLREGVIHNYLRMLWGKKILEWSPSWRDALRVMIDLNNKYGIDGCDPNSYTGIFWVLGRYDRPWGPERPIFGKVRYMSSENTARKVRVEGYIARQLDNR